jgi:hypothetical protein
MKIIVLFFLLAAPLFGQSWQDLSQAQPMNFDKLLTGTDKMIYVAPPEGKYWVIVAGSIAIERETPNATIMVWLDHAPYAPYRDPITGEMIGCHRCVNLIRVRASHTFVPIVGGYARDGTLPVLQGQTMPIVIAYPHRLMLMVTPVHGGLSEPLKTWIRFSIVEKVIAHSLLPLVPPASFPDLSPH